MHYSINKIVSNSFISLELFLPLGSLAMFGFFLPKITVSCKQQIVGHKPTQFLEVLTLRSKPTRLEEFILVRKPFKFF